MDCINMYSFTYRNQIYRMIHKIKQINVIIVLSVEDALQLFIVILRPVTGKSFNSPLNAGIEILPFFAFGSIL